MKRFAVRLWHPLLLLVILSLLTGLLGCHKAEDESGDKNYYNGKDFHPGGKGKSGKSSDM